MLKTSKILVSGRFLRLTDDNTRRIKTIPFVVRRHSQHSFIIISLSWTAFPLCPGFERYWKLGWVSTMFPLLQSLYPTRYGALFHQSDKAFNLGALQEFNVSDIRIHPNFNNATLVNDIALLKLERAAKRQQVNQILASIVCVQFAMMLGDPSFSEYWCGLHTRTWTWRFSADQLLRYRLGSTHWKY